MRHNNSKKLYDYWNRLRGDRTAPDRREIEPSDIREVLGDTFILELDKKYQALSFRLAGTRLCSAYGRELKGIGFLSLWEEKNNLDVYKCVKTVFHEAKPCVISYTAETEGNRIIDYEMLLLPLLNGPAHASRILGITSPLKKSIWLGSDLLENNSLKFARIFDAEEVENTIVSSPSIDPVDDVKENSARKVKHLTIIDGGAA